MPLRRCNGWTPRWNLVAGDLDDVLWSIQRQSRAVQDVVADARLIWRDANARAAEQRFLRPLRRGRGTIHTAVGAQHRSLNSAAGNPDVLRAEEQHRIAAQESALVQGECIEQANRCAQSAFSEAGVANAQAAQADGLAAEARNYIAQADAVGGG